MGTPWLWIGFNAVVLAALAFDLGVFHRQSRIISISEAAVWSVLWVSVSLAFGFAIFFFHGSAASLEFFTGYLIEKALSLDNLLVILLIFRTFAVSEQYQPRVLSWGIVGALIMRGAMIALGATLVNRFSWILYLFGAFLVFAGGHMLFSRQTEIHPERSRLFLWVRKTIPPTRTLADHAAVSRARGDRAFGRGLRRGLDSCSLRHHTRSIYRLHLERSRDSGSAGALLFAGRFATPVKISQ